MIELSGMVGNNILELVQQDIEKVSALLLTSSFEGFPMTLLEALSWGDSLYQCRLCLRAC